MLQGRPWSTRVEARISRVRGSERRDQHGVQEHGQRQAAPASQRPAAAARHQRTHAAQTSDRGLAVMYLELYTEWQGRRSVTEWPVPLGSGYPFTGRTRSITRNVDHRGAHGPHGTEDAPVRHHGLAGAQRDDASQCCAARRRGCICGELTALDQHPPHPNLDRCQPHPTSNGPQPHPHSNHSDSRNDSMTPLSAPSVRR